MTSGKHRKKLARQRAARTGEAYTAALRHVRKPKEDPVPGTTSRVIASCSFCGKDNTQVKKLIAGPGIYICDECVGLCQELIQAEPSAGDAEAAAAYENRSADEVLSLLPAVARTVESVEADLRRWVSRLRASGTSWEEIGDGVGISADAAKSRFNPPS